MAGQKRTREAERTYTFEEFVKEFCPADLQQESDKACVEDDAQDAGACIANKALRELQENLLKTD